MGFGRRMYELKNEFEFLIYFFNFLGLNVYEDGRR